MSLKQQMCPELVPLCIHNMYSSACNGITSRDTIPIPLHSANKFLPIKYPAEGHVYTSIDVTNSLLNSITSAGLQRPRMCRPIRAG